MAEPTVEPPLDGYTVVDLSTGIAGAYCTKLLADGGAHVVKVEPPEGDPLRSWSASGAVTPPGRDGALFSFLVMEGDVIRTIKENIQDTGHFHTGGVPGRHELDVTQELNYRPVCQAIADRDSPGMWPTNSSRCAIRYSRWQRLSVFATCEPVGSGLW